MINLNMDHNEDVRRWTERCGKFWPPLVRLAILMSWRTPVPGVCSGVSFVMLRLPSSAKLFRAKLLCSYIHCPDTDRQTLERSTKESKPSPSPSTGPSSNFLVRQLRKMPSKIQVDENSVFLYRCLVNSDCKSVCLGYPVDPHSGLADFLTSDRLQRGRHCYEPQGSSSAHAL